MQQEANSRTAPEQGEPMTAVQVNRDQLAEVLEQIANYSRPDEIRDHVRQVITSLRGTGVIFINGPAQTTATIPEAAGGAVTISQKAIDVGVLAVMMERGLTSEGSRDWARPIVIAALTAAAPTIAGAERERIRQLALSEAERIRRQNFSDLDGTWAGTLEDFADLLGTATCEQRPS